MKTTEMTATPTELAICWVMLSSVEPRATWCDRSVLSADVMIGIIVPPMPRPMMKSTGMMKPQYGVVGADLGQREHAAGDEHQAERARCARPGCGR